MPKVQISEAYKLYSQFSAEKKAVNQALSQLEAGMNDFCQMQSFTGKAADSVKAYLKEVHGPLIKGLMQAGDALQQEYKKMLDDFQHHVDNAPDAVIREEHLESVNSDLRSLQQQFESIYREMAADVQEAGDVADFAVPSPGQVSSEIENREHEVQQLKQKFSVFAAAGQTGDAKALLSAVEQAMANIKKQYSLTFGSDSFYKPGAFSKTAAGQTLASLTEAGEQAGLGGSPNVIVDGTKMIVKYSVLGMKTIPAGLARMKGLKMKKVGDYIYITGERKWMELYLDRYGKSGKHQLFNTSLTSGQAVRISKRKVNGQLQLRPQGDYLIQESKDVKNYLTKNKFKVFGSGFKSSLNSNWDFVKKENWTKLGAAGKYVKGAGIVGTGLTVYSDVEKYSKKTPTPVNFMKMSTDIGVDLTAGATATGVGAAVGAAFLGPVGAVVGAAAGAFASWLLYRKFGKLGNKSITGLAKETLNKEDQKITSWLK